MTACFSAQQPVAGSATRTPSVGLWCEGKRQLRRKRNGSLQGRRPAALRLILDGAIESLTCRDCDAAVRSARQRANNNQ